MSVTISGPAGGGRQEMKTARCLKSVTFTGTGDSDATSFSIFGRILGVESSGGDAAWDYEIKTNAGAVLFTSGNVGTSATYKPVYIASTASGFHPVVAGPLKVDINNAGASAVVKVLYEE